MNAFKGEHYSVLVLSITKMKRPRAIVQKFIYHHRSGLQLTSNYVLFLLLFVLPSKKPSPLMSSF